MNELDARSNSTIAIPAELGQRFSYSDRDNPLLLTLRIEDVDGGLWPRAPKPLRAIWELHTPFGPVINLTGNRHI